MQLQLGIVYCHNDTIPMITMVQLVSLHVIYVHKGDTTNAVYYIMEANNLFLEPHTNQKVVAINTVTPGIIIVIEFDYDGYHCLIRFFITTKAS